MIKHKTGPFCRLGEHDVTYNVCLVSLEALYGIIMWEHKPWGRSRVTSLVSYNVVIVSLYVFSDVTRNAGRLFRMNKMRPI